MGKPVVVRIISQLLLIAAIRSHAPDLHAPTADRTEVDILAVGCIFRPIVQPNGGCELRFLAPINRNTINIIVAVA